MKESILYKIIRPILYLYLKIRYNPIVIGSENIKKQGNYILAGTHTGYLDGLTLGYTTKRPIRYVAKIELFKGIKGFFFKALGFIPVDRSVHDKSVIPMCCKYLEQKSLIAIFPEGTINKTSNYIMPFKKGAVVMAKRSNSPIIPFAINGIYKRNKLKIIIGKPYYIKSDDIELENKLLEDKVISLIKQIKE